MADIGTPDPVSPEIDVIPHVVPVPGPVDVPETVPETVPAEPSL